MKLSAICVTNLFFTTDNKRRNETNHMEHAAEAFMRK